MNANGSKASSNGTGQHQAGSDAKRLMCRGVRGATTVTSNDRDEMMIRVNDIDVDDVASIYLTTTSDLDATYPAFAARQLGWFDLALLCGHEMHVPDGLPRCIRVLIHWNTTKTATELGHIYLRDAKVLRADRDNIPPIRPVQMSNMDAAMKVLANG
jgi:chorismate mutase